MPRLTCDDGIDGEKMRRITRGNILDRRQQQNSALEINKRRTRNSIPRSTTNRRQVLASIENSRKDISFNRKRKRLAGIPEDAVSEDLVSFTAHPEPLADPSLSAHSLGSADGDERQERRSKRQDLPSPSGTHHPPGFWDDLSEIYLNKRALQEFDRRTLSNNKVTEVITPSTHIAADQSLVQYESVKYSKRSPDLKRFARAGGPDLSDLKGYPPPPLVPMGSQNSTLRGNANISDMDPPTQLANRRNSSVVDGIESASVSNGTKSAKTKSSKASAYDLNFMNILAKNGVKPMARHDLPGNFDQWKKRLAQPHASLSPTTFTNAQFDEFCKAIELASTEPKVMISIFPTLKGADTYSWDADRLCNNWTPLAKNVVTAKPDYAEGAFQTPENDQLRQLMSSMTVPYNDYEAPFLPNFFAEAKSSKGVERVARLQACYDGAMGARGMHHIQNYRRREIFDGNAYTFTSTLVSGVLRTYLHFMTQPNGPDKEIEYHMTLIDSWLLDQSIESFHAGVAAFRNARNMAHEFREQFIREANERIKILSLVSTTPSPERILATESDQIQSDHAELITLPNTASNPDLDPNEQSTKRRKISMTAETTVTPKLKAVPKSNAAAGKAKVQKVASK